MEQTKKAAFGLINSRFSKLNFDFDSKSETSEIGIKFDPHGIYFAKHKRFEIILHFTAFNDENSENPFLSCTMHSLFEFEDLNSFSEIPQYFYRNSIAIIFPYLRAFISSISIQANNNMILLPTMNLSSLESPLKEHTIESKD